MPRSARGPSGLSRSNQALQSPSLSSRTPSLNHRIARFYDASSPLWLDVWGDHMHHGYYGIDGRREKPRREAQLDLIDELIDFAHLPDRVPARILDAGCGVGGSARYLAGYFAARVLGVTLSGVQAARGRAYAEAEGCAHLVDIQRRDVYAVDEPGGFDVVWSLESAEHMPDKARLLGHFYRQLRPGGTLALVTWCHREEPPALRAGERRRLRRIGELYHLPPWVPLSRYVEAAGEAGFAEIRTADWSRAVAPFWGEVIRSALTLRGAAGLLRSGLGTLAGAYAMRHMRAGFADGSIRFVALTARKPVLAEASQKPTA